MIMQTALLSLLHQRYGGACHLVGAGSWNPKIAMGNPDIAQCWTVPRHAPFPLSMQWPLLVRALRRSAPGPIYVAEYQYRQLPRVKRLLRTSGIDMSRCVFIDESPGDKGHWIDALLRLGARTPSALRESDYPLVGDTQLFAPRLTVLDSERRMRDAWLRARGWRGRTLVLVQPGNHRSMSPRSRRRWFDRDDKMWPTEHWRELLRALRQRLPEAIIALRGAIGEIPMLEAMRQALGLRDVEVLGLELRPLFALLEVTHSMISVDTGPAHAAAALGVPVVVLFGAASPGAWLARGPPGVPVIGVGGPPERHHVLQIGVREVVDAWGSVLALQKHVSRAALVPAARGERLAGDRMPCSDGAANGVNTDVAAPVGSIHLHGILVRR